MKPVPSYFVLLLHFQGIGEEGLINVVVFGGGTYCLLVERGLPKRSRVAREFVEVLVRLPHALRAEAFEWESLRSGLERAVSVSESRYQ